MAKEGAAAAGVAAFQPLDFALTLIGCRLFPSTWPLVLVVNHLWFLTWLGIIVAANYAMVTSLTQSGGSIAISFVIFSQVTYAEAIAYLLLTRVYRLNLRRLLQESWDHVSGSRRRRLWFTSAAYACLWMSRAIAYTVNATQFIKSYLQSRLATQASATARARLRLRREALSHSLSIYLSITSCWRKSNPAA